MRALARAEEHASGALEQLSHPGSIIGPGVRTSFRWSWHGRRGVERAGRRLGLASEPITKLYLFIARMYLSTLGHC